MGILSPPAHFLDGNFGNTGPAGQPPGNFPPAPALTCSGSRCGPSGLEAIPARSGAVHLHGQRGHPEGGRQRGLWLPELPWPQPLVNKQGLPDNPGEVWAEVGGPWSHPSPHILLEKSWPLPGVKPILSTKRHLYIPSCTHSLIHLCLHRCFLSTYYAPGTVLGIKLRGLLRKTRQTKSLVPMELTV